MRLSHLDAEGRARMVDVGGKPITQRVAVATGQVRMTAAAFALVLDATAGARSTLHGAPGADVEAVTASAGGEFPRIEGNFSGLVVPAAQPSSQETALPSNVIDPRTIDSRILSYELLEDCLLVVRVEGEGREIVERLVAAPLGPVKIVAAVSPDVDLSDRDLLLWGIFTRFDCARDVVFTEVQHRGAWSTAHGVMGIDATFKPGYPAALEMDPEIVATVDRRWSEYGID